MENQIELENGSKLVFTGGHTSNVDGVVSIGQSGANSGVNDRLLLIKFGDKECSDFGNDDHVKIERDFFAMNETERKFIIMSRISALLSRKGLIAGVTIFPSECAAGSFCQINVQDEKSTQVLDSISSRDATEQDLLDWWSVIENGVE